jgi:hypothetical protein
VINRQSLYRSRVSDNIEKKNFNAHSIFKLGSSITYKSGSKNPSVNFIDSCVSTPSSHSQFIIKDTPELIISFQKFTWIP